MTVDEIDVRFRKNLKATREFLGLSQSELARRMGVNASYICDLESGRRKSVRLNTVARLATVLKVDASALLSHNLHKKSTKHS